MPRGFRTVTATAPGQWVYRIAAAIFLLMGFLSSIAGILQAPPARVAWTGQAGFFWIIGLFYLSRLGSKLAVSDEMLLVSRGGFSRKFVRWGWIQAFVWRHDLEGFAHPGQRLWVILDDGQACRTPVVISPGSIFSVDVCLTDEQAHSLVETLTAMRNRRRPQ